MIHVTTPPLSNKKLSFFLAMEEYVARHCNDADDMFFMWQVAPTVIFGRNQDVQSEVNLDYCRAHGIEMFRRKSGGGCVYADPGNLMCSFVTRDENVALTFNRFMTLMALMLYRIGIDAKVTGHNDILVDGQKVSGNAFYHIPGHSIVHGTLLYDVNVEHLVNSITPPTEKLERHGVQSVRQRVTMLRQYTTKTLDQLKEYLKTSLCTQELMLTPDDIKAIEHIELEYLDHNFIFKPINH